MPADREELRAVAHRLHAHYEVEPELDIRDGTRVPVALVVRLWAVHEKGARALPGCPRCWELRSELERLAGFALDAPVTATVTVEPLRPALYDSRVVPGADEVGLSIRLTHGHGGEPIDGREERSVKTLRGRLALLGIPEE